MSSPESSEGVSDQYAKLQAFLDSAIAIVPEKSMGSQLRMYNEKEISYGRVQIHQMGDHIKIEVQHEDGSWSEFKVDESGVFWQKGKGSLTINQVIAEL